MMWVVKHETTNLTTYLFIYLFIYLFFIYINDVIRD